MNEDTFISVITTLAIRLKEAQNLLQSESRLLDLESAQHVTELNEQVVSLRRELELYRDENMKAANEISLRGRKIASLERELSEVQDEAVALGTEIGDLKVKINDLHKFMVA
jgi:uncharacterized coiled-coil DUF342 family protein